MLSANAAALTGNSQIVTGSPGFYAGFTVRETSGSAAAVIRIWDNASAASGTILDVISLTSGQSISDYLPNGGVRAYNGIYVEKVSGAFEGSVRFA